MPWPTGEVLRRHGEGRMQAVKRAAFGCPTDLVAAVAAGAADAAAFANEGTEAQSDINASSEYREHLARVLVRRSLEESGLS